MIISISYHYIWYAFSDAQSDWCIWIEILLKSYVVARVSIVRYQSSSHKLCNALDKYPTLYHIVTTIYTCTHFCYKMVRCGICNCCIVELWGWYITKYVWWRILYSRLSCYLSSSLFRWHSKEAKAWLIVVPPCSKSTGGGVWQVLQHIGLLIHWATSCINPYLTKHLWEKRDNKHVFAFAVVLPFIVRCQYRGCWCIGDTGSQGTSILGIDTVLPEFRPRHQTNQRSTMASMWTTQIPFRDFLL